MWTYRKGILPEFLWSNTGDLCPMYDMINKRQCEDKVLTASPASCVSVDELCHGWTWGRKMTLTLPSYFPPGLKSGRRTLSIVNASFALKDRHISCGYLLSCRNRPERADIVH